MKKVLIVGYFGFNNFGDEAILLSLINDLTSCGFTRENITVISSNPELTINIHNVNAIQRWNPIELISSIIFHNSLIFTGGIFQDKTSFRSFLWYLLILIFGIILGKEIVFYAIGIGPLQGKLTQLLFLTFAKNINLSTARDQLSTNMLPMSEKTITSCDPAWNLKPDLNVQKKIQGINWSLPIIGISIKPDKQLKPFHINYLADKLAKLLSDTKEWQVVFIPCMPNEDLPITYELYDLTLQKAQENNRIFVIEDFSNFTVLEQAGILASCTLMVGMRYHALLFPITNGKPVLGLIFDYKIKSLVDFAGQVGLNPKEDLEGAWNYFWQNIDGSIQAAKKASEKAKKLHTRNIDLLKKLLIT